MPNGYSNDLRQRVLAYYDDNHTQKETCAVFGISRSALNDWLKLRRDTGTANLRPRPKRRKSKKIDRQKLKDYIAAHPDAYLYEIATAFGVVPSAIWYACHRHGITRKKSKPATENETKTSGKPSSKQ
jgi:transposase